ncbi:hypothetical protein HELRODRAFT_82540, partial [Helobdella robusta]|uniref:ATPase dynein-related AAA domain-containing protein n=1 Tax=Helobdella robusta TaxID=6412 RepID=T1G4T4_HELRO
SSTQAEHRCLRYMPEIVLAENILKVGRFELSRSPRVKLFSDRYKPVDLKVTMKAYVDQFMAVFLGTYKEEENTQFIAHVQDYFKKRNWNVVLELTKKPLIAALNKPQCKLRSDWLKIQERFDQLAILIQKVDNAPAFSFVQGTLVEAILKGEWVLLDEINLATHETLECLGGLLDSKSGSVVLTDRGDIEPIVRHADFRIFACMNPAVDVGKKELSVGIRNRWFTEFYVDELTSPRDLTILVNEYLQGSVSLSVMEGIVKFYGEIRRRARVQLTDGVGNKPYFSMRTLCRALRLAGKIDFGGKMKSIYEVIGPFFLRNERMEE